MEAEEEKGARQDRDSLWGRILDASRVNSIVDSLRVK